MEPTSQPSIAVSSPVVRRVLTVVAAATLSVLGACAPGGDGIRADGVAESAKDDDPDPVVVDDHSPSTLGRLEGTWKSETTGRTLVARMKGQELEFHVLDPAEWHDAYAADEVRFVLIETVAGIVVVDRYRPNPGSAHYDPAGFDDCLSTFDDMPDGPLRARVLPGGRLEVDFVESEVQLVHSATSEISSCSHLRKVARIKRRLVRKK